jgi:hypothetical protein
MDRSEKLVHEYLVSLGFGDIVHEPVASSCNGVNAFCILRTMRQANIVIERPSGSRGLWPFVV